MKKSTLSMISILMVLCGMLCAVQYAFAVDPPHNGKNGMNSAMTCASCHFDATLGTPTWATQATTTDETFYNNMCTSCHNAGGVTDSQYIVKTHASSNFTGKYTPTWSIECRVCHNPHTQDTVTSFPTDSGIDLLTSTVTRTCVQAPVAALSSTLYVVTGSLTPGEWVDYTVVPNTAYPARMYRIMSNTADSITVFGAMNCNYVKFGKPYGIRNGKLLHTQITTPDAQTPIIKFYTKDSSKPNSYASSTDSTNVTGICQVCHTRTKSFNRDGTLSNPTGSIQEGPNHPKVIQTGQVCTSCHIHGEGFKGECNACHGYPPNSMATLVFMSSSNATVSSDSTGPGAHVKHVDSLKLVCANCHTGGMLAGAGEGDNKINIGFANPVGTNIGGVYNGKPGRAVYSYASGTASTTTVNQAAGVEQCSNLYCHSSGQGPTANDPTPVYASPRWNVPGDGACGTCHKTIAGSPLGEISSGSHSAHLHASGVSGCGDCHAGAANNASSYDSTLHINKLIDVVNSYTAGGAAGNGYGTCSAAACHASAYGPGSVVTPTWGNTAGCDACHSGAGAFAADGAPATGSHAIHIDTVGKVCADCHAGAVKDSSGGAGHLSGVIDVTNYGYPTPIGKHAAGSGYSSCSTAACHGASSPVWGANTTDAQCVKCHGVSGTSPAAYASNPDTAAPGYNGTGRDTAGNTANTSPKVGAHDAHLRGLGGFKTGGIACTDCHAVTTLTDSGHMNGTTSFTWSALASKGGAMTPSYSGGNCSNVYCHNGAKYLVTQGTGTMPSWTDAAYLANPASTMDFADCNKCHQSPAFANVNYNHSGVVLGAGNCTSCHGHDGAGATHIDGILQAQGGTCNACHDYDVDAVTGDWGKNPKAIEGWGAHAEHINHLKKLSGATLSAATDTFGGTAYNKVCGVCHTQNSSNHAMGGGPRWITFGDGSNTYQFSVSSGSPTYYGVAGVSSATKPKTCSNVSCHFQTSPVWEGI